MPSKAQEVFDTLKETGTKLEDLEKGIAGFNDRLTNVEERGVTKKELDAWREELKKVGEEVALAKSIAESRRAISVDGVDGGRFNLAKAMGCAGLELAEGKGSDPWNTHEAGYEKEVIDAALTEAEKRDMSLGDDGSVGFLLPVQVMDGLIEKLRSKLVLDGIGTTFVPDLEGSRIEWDKETGTGDTGWGLENVSVTTTTDPNVGKIILRPHEAYGLRKMSLRMLLGGSQRANSFVERTLVMDVLRKIQEGVIRGNDENGAPLGLVNQPDINTVTINATPTVNKLRNMIKEIEADDGDIGSMYWLMGPRTRWAIGDIVASDSTHRQGTPIFTLGDPSKADPGTILGIPYATTTSFDESGAQADAILGVFENLLVGEWGPMVIQATTQTGDAFLKRQKWFLATQMVDVGVVHPESFCLGDDITL